MTDRPPASADQWLPAVQSPDGVRRLWVGIVSIFLIAVLAFLVRGANRPADPVLAPTTSSTSTTTIAVPGVLP